jgi:hypothetical protein
MPFRSASANAVPGGYDRMGAAAPLDECYRPLEEGGVLEAFDGLRQACSRCGDPTGNSVGCYLVRKGPLRDCPADRLRRIGADAGDEGRPFGLLRLQAGIRAWTNWLCHMWG